MYKLKRRSVRNVAAQWALKVIAVGGFKAWKGIAAWSAPITFARTAKGKRFFPLDQKLKLRADHWSEGAARVEARHGLQSKSFDKAAELYSDSTGGSMSGDSLCRITEGFGQHLEEKRKCEAERVYAEQTPESAQAVVTITDPIKGQASISTDGGTVLLRGEGWKEFKMSVISEVRGKARKPSSAEPQPDPQVTLHRHSYQVGLWTADQIGQHQYLEGTRRQVEGCARLSSPNDGAVWINRITTANYARIIYVIDWAHASGRLSNVAKAAFGDGTVAAQQWAHDKIDRLWNGRVAEVVSALQTLDWEQIATLDDIRNSPAYFESRQANMDYARLRRDGYPIGSGAVEGGDQYRDPSPHETSGAWLETRACTSHDGSAWRTP